MASNIRVGLIDADQDIRFGRKLAINAHPELTLVFEADNARAAIEKVPDLLIDVLLIDYRTRGAAGTELAGKILSIFRERGDRAPAVIITGPYSSDSLRLESIRYGAQDFVSQDLSMAALIDAIVGSQSKSEQVELNLLLELFHRSEVPQNQNDVLLTEFDQLPELERRVLDEFICGRTDQEIAGKLELSNYRVRKAFDYLKMVFNCSTRAQMALLLFENGLLRGDKHVE